MLLYSTQSFLTSTPSTKLLAGVSVDGAVTSSAADAKLDSLALNEEDVDEVAMFLSAEEVLF